ncbi:MAG: cytoplasmic protein [Pseudomonadota bacterium]
MKDKNKFFVTFDTSSQKTSHPQRQFDQFEASSLYCSRCKQPVPVRKRLLLALPDGDKYDYLCVYCGSSVGTKTERSEIPLQVIIK